MSHLMLFFLSTLLLLPFSSCHVVVSEITPQAEDVLLLFIDDFHVESMDSKLKRRIQQPTKNGLVISPTKPWESWAVFAYNSVLRVNDEDLRIYYDCIEGSGVPPGLKSSNLNENLSHRRICLATSTDGKTWNKPNLGIFNRNGSLENNIVVEDSGVSVFIDDNPTTPASEKFKMACSNAAYASPDGIKWTRLPWTKIAEDDTKPTAHWDPVSGKYIIYVRRDVTGPSTRCIGRCTTSNFSNWQEELKPGDLGCPVVFCTDSSDPLDVDIYTNAWTPYPKLGANNAINLFFPSMYHHFSDQAPYGFGNDGLLDIRMVTSRVLTNTVAGNLSYVPADNARHPFVPLGINKCGPGASRPSVPGGWCSLSSHSTALRNTNTDTSAMYMADGHLFSVDGTEVYLYSSAQPFTHGSDAAKGIVWGKNSGIMRLSMRRDGFVAIEAPYDFSGGANRSMYPTISTTTFKIPSQNCIPSPAPSPSIYPPMSKTSCGYNHPPLNICPSSEPVARCNKTADCDMYDKISTPTCFGVDVACNTSGFCTTGVLGGDLCLSNRTPRDTIGPHIYVNMKTSVAGWVALEVLQDGKTVTGCELENADLLRGNSIAARATWGETPNKRFNAHRSETCDIAALLQSGRDRISLKVAMVDSELYSIRVACKAF